MVSVVSAPDSTAPIAERQRERPVHVPEPREIGKVRAVRRLGLPRRIHRQCAIPVPRVRDQHERRRAGGPGERADVEPLFRRGCHSQRMRKQHRMRRACRRFTKTWAASATATVARCAFNDAARRSRSSASARSVSAREFHDSRRYRCACPPAASRVLRPRDRRAADRRASAIRASRRRGSSPAPVVGHCRAADRHERRSLEAATAVGVLELDRARRHLPARKRVAKLRRRSRLVQRQRSEFRGAARFAAAPPHHEGEMPLPV